MRATPGHCRHRRTSGQGSGSTRSSGINFRSRTVPALFALNLLVPVIQACDGKDGGGSDVTVDHSSAGNPPDLSSNARARSRNGDRDTDMPNDASETIKRLLRAGLRTLRPSRFERTSPGMAAFSATCHRFLQRSEDELEHE